MFTSRVIIILFFLNCFYPTFSQQSDRKIYKAIKKNNKKFLQWNDSTIFTHYELISRYKDSIHRVRNVFFFIEKKTNDFQFLKSESYGEVYFFKDSFKFTNYLGDEYWYKEENIFKRDGKHNSNRYFVLNRIPTKKKGDFSRFRYSKPIIVSEGVDTLVVLQTDRKYKQKRYLYIDNNFRIIKYKIINDNSERPDSAFIFKIQYFQNNHYDSLSRTIKSFNNLMKTKFDENEMDKNKIGGDTLFILNDSFLTNHKNKYILLDYWYIGCLPCLKLMPFIQDLKEKVDTSKIVILGVNTVDDEKTVLRFFDKKGYTGLELDNKKMVPPHKIQEHPTIILIDENLNIVRRYVGYSGKLSNLKILSDLKSLGLIKD